MRAFATHIRPGFAVSSLVLACIACAAPARVAAQTLRDTDSTLAYTERGEATWYGPRHEGRRTTSGEKFDSSKLTAAHSSLPMGAWVRVTDTGTGRSIVVRVNDREPPHGVRCIDLSRAAAARLGMLGRGVADVSLARISPAEATRAPELAEAPEAAQTVEAAAHRHAIAPHGRRHTRHASR
jgi:rare lipoprotein A